MRRRYILAAFAWTAFWGVLALVVSGRLSGQLIGVALVGFGTGVMAASEFVAPRARQQVEGSPMTDKAEVWDQPDLDVVRRCVAVAADDAREPERHRRLYAATLAAIDDGRIIMKLEAGSFDAAWAAVLAALPEGWSMFLLQAVAQTWAVSAHGPKPLVCDQGSTHGPQDWCHGRGDTPVAALNDLETKLREIKP